MTDHEPQPKHRPNARDFWAKYLLGTFVLLLLTAPAFSQQFGFRLAAPTFCDYWVGVPCLLIGGFFLVAGVSSR